MRRGHDPTPRRRAALAITFGLLALGAQRGGPECPSLPIDPGDPARYRSRGAYCEGRYLGHAEATPLAIASLTAGVAPIDPQRAGQLVARWSRAPTREPVRLEVNALGRTYYRLDAVVRDENEFRWPADVLKSVGLATGALGAVAWSGDPTRRTIYPVKLMQEGGAAPVLRNEALLLPSADFESISVTVARVSPGDTKVIRRQSPLPGFRFPARVAVHVPLPELDGAKEPATFRLEFRGRMQGGRGSAVSSATVQHPGSW